MREILISCFLSYDVVCAHPYRIMRNADLTIDEDEAEDLLVEIQRQLKKRQWGEVIRLEVEDKMDERLLKILKMEFDIKEADIFEINGPLDLTMLMKVYGAEGFDALQKHRDISRRLYRKFSEMTKTFFR